jgi:hypothetical protein
LAESTVNFFVRNRSASSHIGLTALHSLQNVQVIQDIVDAAIVG